MNTERKYLKGLGEPLSRSVHVMKFDIEKTMYLIKAIGAKSFRMWMMYDDLFLDYNVLNSKAVSEYHYYLSMLKQAGVEKVVGMNYQWFYPHHIKTDGLCVPFRDMTKGSDYMIFLDMFEEMWYTLAKEFPEIDLWETGNELNHSPFNHPLEFHEKGTVFNAQQRADIMCDMMYRAKRAVIKANPDATVIMPALAPIEIINESPNLAEFMELLYSSITGGRYESDDPDDYFDALAWHPYTQNKAPTAEWLEYQRKIYDISLKYEKKPKKVYYTEVGWTDLGDENADRQQAEYYKQLYDMVSEELPFVEMLIFFRLYEDTPLAEWGGVNEIYYGMFREPQNGFKAKAKAFVMQQICGGSGDLRRFEEKQ